MQSIDSFFERLTQNIQKLSAIESQVDPAAVPAVDDIYHSIEAVMTEVTTACDELEAEIGSDEALLKETRTRFQKEFTPWLTKGWVGNRVIEKPQGYAGDYRTLIMIYDTEIPDTGFPGYVDLWMHHITLPRSICSRWQEMRKFLTKELSSRSGDVSVLDIASGPCREFSKPLELTSDCTVHLQCLDNDPASLEYVKENVVAVSGIKDFKLDRYNALRLKSSSNTIRAFGKFDIVYSIGLFDYIDDVRLVQILKGVRELVNEGGVVYLNFKDSAEYSAAEYQWLLDWHFYQRTEQECLDLFAQAGYEMSYMEPTTRDETGVIINFVNRVSGPSLRIDTASSAVPKPNTAKQAETKKNS